MDNLKKITILHSNDLHGDFLADDTDHSLVGGVSLLSGYVNKVREEEKNTIYAIAGDMFRGSVIDSEYQGISTIEIMNMLSPDVVTVGNHETDYGIAHLLFLEKCAKFPIINANLHIRTNSARLFRPHIVIERDGMRILFIGIVTEEVISQTKNDGLIGSFVDINEAAAEIGRICNAYNATDIDMTVLLTHIGFEEDKALAKLLDPAWGVDLIIGGHSHTFIEEPAVVNNIPIVQAGTGTDFVGRFDVIINTDTNSIESFTWQSVPIDAEHCPKDEDIERIIGHYRTVTDEKYDRMITHFRKKLTHPSRTQETALGGLLADALKNSLGLDIMLLGSGSVRCESMGPIVLLKNLTEAFPYDDAVYMFRVNGKQLRDMIRFMLREGVWQGEHCEFYQFSEGLRVVYDRNTQQFEEFSFDGMEVTEDKLYKVGLQTFHFKNIEDFFRIPMSEIEKNGKPRVVTTSCREVLEEYLSANQNLDRDISGRLVVKHIAE